MKKLLLILALFLSFHSFAQIRASSQNPFHELLLVQYDVDLSNEASGDSPYSAGRTLGSPYLNKEFIAGAVYDTEKVQQGRALMRYNILSDEIEVQTDKNKYFALLKNPDIYAEIGGDTFIYAAYKGDTEKGSFFQKIYNGEPYSLFKRYIMKFHKYKST